MTSPNTTYVTDMHDMSMNESRFGPLPSVQAAVEQGAAQLHRYPSFVAPELVAALVQRFGVSLDDVLVGPGSVGLTQHLMAAFGRSGARCCTPGAVVRGLPDADGDHRRRLGAGAAGRRGARPGRDGRARSPTAPG